MFRRSKKSDYEQKEFKVVSTKLKRFPLLGILFLLLALIFAYPIVSAPATFLNVLRIVIAFDCLGISIVKFIGSQTVVCPYCGTEKYLFPLIQVLKCRQCKKKSFRG